MSLFPSIIALAFVCEFVDSALGMGYGTTLTPLLMMLGYEPLQIVPAILLSEFATGFIAAFSHHRLGNVDLRPGTHAFKVAGVLAACSTLGVVSAVVLALNVPKTAVKLYVGVLVLLMGITILVTMSRRKSPGFSWRKVIGLGLVAAFNKGISGGGYGPVVTGGQMLSGVDPKNAIAICSLAEGVTSAVGVVAYLAAGREIGWILAPSLALGAVLSAPLAAFAVSKVSTGRMTAVVGGFTTALGIWTLLGLLG
ncbi:MAG TPA: sulfite exporter TauE/SafE family protein [Anaerolineae bacterium]|nr:sulfite exporter TauE/SafE family protein [Anaerolineae bacterium]